MQTVSLYTAYGDTKTIQRTKISVKKSLVQHNNLYYILNLISIQNLKKYNLYYFYINKTLINNG